MQTCARINIIINYCGVVTRAKCDLIFAFERIFRDDSLQLTKEMERKPALLSSLLTTGNCISITSCQRSSSTCSTRAGSRRWSSTRRRAPVHSMGLTCPVLAVVVMVSPNLAGNKKSFPAREALDGRTLSSIQAAQQLDGVGTVARVGRLPGVLGPFPQPLWIRAVRRYRIVGAMVVEGRIGVKKIIGMAYQRPVEYW